MVEQPAALVVVALRLPQARRRSVSLPWLPDFNGHWHVGIESSGWLGLGHHELRFGSVSDTQAHSFPDLIFTPAEMAHLDQSFCRGNDAAVICAAIFPGGTGRVWMAGILRRFHNWGIWQNFRSPLMWDVFAVSTYFTVSVLFGIPV